MTQPTTDEQRILDELNRLRKITLPSGIEDEDVASFLKKTQEIQGLDQFAPSVTDVVFGLRKPFNIDVIRDFIQDTADIVMGNPAVPQTAAIRSRVEQQVAALLLNDDVDLSKAFTTATPVFRAVLDAVVGQNEKVRAFPGAATKEMQLSAVIRAMEQRPELTGVTFELRKAILQDTGGFDRALLPQARLFLAVVLDNLDEFVAGAFSRKASLFGDEFNLTPQDFRGAVVSYLGTLGVDDIRAGNTPVPVNLLPEAPEVTGSQQLIEILTPTTGTVVRQPAIEEAVDKALRIQEYKLDGAKPLDEEGKRNLAATIRARNILIDDAMDFITANPGDIEGLASFIVGSIGAFDLDISKASTDLGIAERADDAAEEVKRLANLSDNDLIREVSGGKYTAKDFNEAQLSEFRMARREGKPTAEDVEGWVEATKSAKRLADFEAKREAEGKNAPSILNTLLRTAKPGYTREDFTDDRLDQFEFDIAEHGAGFVRAILRGDLGDRRLAGFLADKKDELTAEAAKKAAQEISDQSLDDRIRAVTGGFLTIGDISKEQRRTLRVIRRGGDLITVDDVRSAWKASLTEETEKAAAEAAATRAEILGDPKKTEKDAQKQLHVVGIDWEDLLPEDFDKVFEHVRLGGVIDSSDDLDWLNERVAAKQQYDINVEAVSKEGITRTLRDLGVVSLGVDDEFTRRVEGTTIPQIQQILAELDPTAPLDTQAIATQLLGLKSGEPATPMMEITPGSFPVMQDETLGELVKDIGEPPIRVPRFTDPVGQQFAREEAMMPNPLIDYKSREQLIRDAAQIYEADTPGLSAGVTAALVASGRQPLPTLGTVGTITEEERLRLQFPDDLEAARFAAEASGGDPFFQQSILEQLGLAGSEGQRLRNAAAFKAQFRSFAAEKQRARETEAFKRFAFRAGPEGELPPLETERLTPAELLKLSDKQQIQIAKQKKQRTPGVHTFGRFRRASAVQPTSSLDFARTQLPRFKEAFELEPATIDRRQREQEKQGALDTQRSLRKGRTIFRFGT
jgi:hypothetical protein